MNTPLKLTSAAIATIFIASAGAVADDTKLVPISNHHGARTFVYRQTDQLTTVGVYAGGNGLGDANQRDFAQNGHFRFVLRCDHHGHERAMYVAE